MAEVDFAKIEKKWQEKWEKEKVFEVSEKSKKKKYYVLEMFPYPSGEGIHMGHAFNYTIGDVFSRFKIMQGFNVLHPMGWDALGLPAENAAIKAKTSPQDYTNKSIPNFIKQQKKLGLTYDWTRLVNTADPEYYKWDQWIFLKMFEKGLVYEKEAPVNWCPKCNTILANEQVQNGKCWRHEDTDVEVKNVRQLFLKITDYADRLLKNHEKLNWPEKTIAMQKNWIGKSHGTEIDFEVSTFGDLKDKEFVFLHAYGDSIDSVFWKWLREEIESRSGKIVFAESLPNPSNPNLKEQMDFVLSKYNFNKNTIVVGHSLGNVLTTKILENLKTKIAGFVAIAPPLPRKKEDIINGKAFKDLKPRPSLADYFNWEIDYNKAKKNVEKVIVLEDKEDHIVPPSNPREFASLMEGNYQLAKGNKTHYNGEKEEEVLNLLFKKWPIFTTRPDTLYGVTFMVVSAQHPKLKSLVTKEQEKDVEKFLKKIISVSEKDSDILEKEGVFTGSYAINPVTKDKVPIYTGNFVVADYGSGMVMAVPAHDQRDFEFAKKYKIEIKQVIQGEITKDRAYTDSGKLINSDKFDDLENEEAKVKITDDLIKKKIGRRVVNYKLRDWSVARQRYWGTPIPLIHCDSCGLVPVPEKDLPVVLPKDVKFGKGNPLESNEEWLNVKCPKCKSKARRETNTMDTFVNSSWYFLRYCDPNNDKEIFDKKKANYWCPVDLYIGGSEHACMHLIYSRFYTMFLKDLGLLNFEEFAPRLFHQGMINDQNGERMSKSKGNVVEPLETMAEYGVDTTRFFLLSEASPDKGFNWSDKGIQGSLRAIKKILKIADEKKFSKDSDKMFEKVNVSVKRITEQIESLDYRKSTIELRELFDVIEKEDCSKETFEKAIKLLAPFCPHICEEIWSGLGHEDKFISTAEWPSFVDVDKKKKKENVDITAKVSEHLKQVIDKVKANGDEIKKVHVYVLPFEKDKVKLKDLQKDFDEEILIYSTADKDKFDPENRSKKARPGMPGVYLE